MLFGWNPSLNNKVILNFQDSPLLSFKISMQIISFAAKHLTWSSCTQKTLDRAFQELSIGM